MTIVDVDWAYARTVAIRRCVQAGADHDDAEDCAQEALAALVVAIGDRGRKRDDGVVADPAAWVATVAYRRFIDTTRRRKRARDLVALLGEDRVVDAAEQRAVATVEARRALRSLAGLPPMTRQVCAGVAQGSGITEVATALAISKRSAEGHLNRARIWLRRVIALVVALVCCPFRWSRSIVAGPISLACVAVAVGVAVVILPGASLSESRAAEPERARGMNPGTRGDAVKKRHDEFVRHRVAPSESRPQSGQAGPTAGAARELPHQRSIPVTVPRHIDDVSGLPLVSPEDITEGPASTERLAAVAGEGEESVSDGDAVVTAPSSPTEVTVPLTRR